MAANLSITITAADVLTAQARCPLVRAALRLDDPDVLRVILRIHPPLFCPAARQHAHERVVMARG